MLLDQHDFLVIGVLGTQGVGKSTVMSALAGDNLSKYVHVVVLLFRDQIKLLMELESGSVYLDFDLALSFSLRLVMLHSNRKTGNRL